MTTFEPGAKMRRWEKNLENPAAALKQIGALMVAESQSAFKKQRFGSDVWEPRAVPSVYGIVADFAAGKKAPAARRFEDRPVLRDTGRLAASIAFRIRGDTVDVGSALPYAGTHQNGGKIESETITGTVQKALGTWLSNKGAEWKSQLGWLLNKKYTGKKRKGKVEARPFIGITKQTLEDVRQVVGVSVMEVR